MKKTVYILVVFTSFTYTVFSQNADSTRNSVTELKKSDTVQQLDLVDIIADVFKVKEKEQRRSDRKFRFSLFPSQSSVSGDKVVLTSFNVAFLLGDTQTTNVSTILFVPYIGFNKRYGFQVQPNVWLKNNSWNLEGEYFIFNYPQNTWGLGGNSIDSNKTMIDYNQIRFHQKILKGVFPHLAIGLGYAYDRHYDIEIEETELSDEISQYFPSSKDFSVSSGITIPVIFDSRHNSLNPQGGFFSSFTYSFYNTVLGSDSNWQSLFWDMRKYFKFKPFYGSILAFRGYYWTIISGTVPYLDLPSNRWEPIQGSTSRGIRQNRYRSNALMYFESEYRFGITANGLIGGVFFTNILSASEYNTQNFVNWHLAAGTGIRLKFNKYSRTNIALDFGFSKEFFNVYLNIGEAF